ncbi:hypothetical protein [Bacillus cereus]
MTKYKMCPKCNGVMSQEEHFHYGICFDCHSNKETSNVLSNISIEDMKKEIERRKEIAVDAFKKAVGEAYANGLGDSDLEDILDNF